MFDRIIGGQTKHDPARILSEKSLVRKCFEDGFGKI